MFDRKCNHACDPAHLYDGLAIISRRRFLGHSREQLSRLDHEPLARYARHNERMGSWPGAASAMVVMAAEFGADARLVALCSTSGSLVSPASHRWWRRSGLTRQAHLTRPFRGFQTFTGKHFRKPFSWRLQAPPQGAFCACPPGRCLLRCL